VVVLPATAPLGSAAVCHEQDRTECRNAQPLWTPSTWYSKRHSITPTD